MAEAVSTASAFDGLASSYDEGFGTNPIGLYFRHVVQERARALFPARGRVLDLGCGTGEDGLYLASLGLEVQGIDPSPRMIERARQKASARGVRGVSYEVLAAEDVGSLSGSFDGAFSNFGALNCADLTRVGRALERILRRGAPLVLSVIGPRPLPGLVRQALTGRRARSVDVRVEGRVVACRALRARDVGDELGPSFRWASPTALGVVVPAPEHEAWARRNPIAFGLSAALERLVRAWPGFRGLGDHLLLEGARI